MKIERILNKAIDNKVFPGAVVQYGSSLEDFRVVVGGRLGYGAEWPMVVGNTMYDVASMTKIVVASTILVLVSDNRLSLDDDVGDMLDLKVFQGVNVRHLLAHSSGLQLAFSPMKDLSSEEIDSRILNTGPVSAPGSQFYYNNQNYYLLGKVVEKITGLSLPQALKVKLFDSLSMKDTMYGPLGDLSERIAPTEDDAWRETVIRGEVHDEVAWKLGGVSGHAGLFSTAEDMFKLGMVYLNRGKGGAQQLISSDLVRESTQRQFPNAAPAPNLGWVFGLGWRVGNTAKLGNKCSSYAYEFSGFTGVTVAVDPVKNIVVAILCNRTFPKRGIKEPWEEVCREVIDIVMGAR